MIILKTIKFYIFYLKRLFKINSPIITKTWVETDEKINEWTVVKLITNYCETTHIKGKLLEDGTWLNVARTQASDYEKHNFMELTGQTYLETPIIHDMDLWNNITPEYKDWYKFTRENWFNEIEQRKNKS